MSFINLAAFVSPEISINFLDPRHGKFSSHEYPNCIIDGLSRVPKHMNDIPCIPRRCFSLRVSSFRHGHRGHKFKSVPYHGFGNPYRLLSNKSHQKTNPDLDARAINNQEHENRINMEDKSASSTPSSSLTDVSVGNSRESSFLSSRRPLGDSKLLVPPVCFGTMLFGNHPDSPQESYARARQQLLTCLQNDINFFDTAEMYPVPQQEETAGNPEKFLGKFLKEMRNSVNRQDIIIASKISGPANMPWIRNGPLKLDSKNILQAVDDSLTRLQVEYLDLIQIHWPDRYVPMFGDVDYDPSRAYGDFVSFQEQYDTLKECIRQGKVRAIGLSNETPYGLMKMIECASASEPIASIQNAYHLLCRNFDSGLAECCHLSNVSLLAYSPLAMGLLTGKYYIPNQENNIQYGGPPEARLNFYKGRYAEAEARYAPTKLSYEAMTHYINIAHEHGMSLTELALRFVLTHPLVASSVFGATTNDQLLFNLRCCEKGPLENEIMEKINQVHNLYPNPIP